jgi:hypothetical protein
MNRRLLLACAAPAVAVPFQVCQAEVLFRAGAISAHDWPALLVANVVLLVGACALAADFPLADRLSRALLVGIGVPLLLPGPTVVDSLVHAVDPGLLFVLPNLLLLMMLGSAEAGIYLLATRPRPQA